MSLFKKENIPSIDDIFGMAFTYYKIAQESPELRTEALAAMGSYSSFGFLIYFLTDDGYFDDDEEVVKSGTTEVPARV